MTDWNDVFAGAAMAGGGLFRQREANRAAQDAVDITAANYQAVIDQWEAYSHKQAEALASYKGANTALSQQNTQLREYIQQLEARLNTLEAQSQRDAERIDALNEEVVLALAEGGAHEGLTSWVWFHGFRPGDSNAVPLTPEGFREEYERCLAYLRLNEEAIHRARRNQRTELVQTLSQESDRLEAQLKADARARLAAAPAEPSGIA